MSIDLDIVQDLVAAAQNGDSDSFGEVFEEYYPLIYQYHWYRCWNRAESQDLTSQTFMRSLEKLDSYDSRKGTFRAWIYRLAHNVLVDHYRRSRPESSVEDAWDLASSEDVAADAELSETLEEVSRLVEQLTADQRNLLLLRVWDGLSYRDIAAVLGKSPDSCKMGFSRIVAGMRGKLAVFGLALVVFNNLMPFEI